MMEIDPARLDRAIHLQAQLVAPGRYWITGGAKPHTVRLDVGWCDCPDHGRDGATCKHLLAARIADGDPVVVAAAVERVRELNLGRAA